MRKCKICLVVSILFFNLFILVNSCFGLEFGKELYGEEVVTKKPNMDFHSILSGDYQQLYGEWFEENLSVRNIMVRSYNELLYKLQVTNNSIICGKDNWLYSTDYVEAYYKYIQLPNVEITYPEYAKKIKTIQDRLKKRGKTFIYVISPSKAEIYPEYIPFRYKNMNYLERKTNREREIGEFKRNNVNYYDTKEDMLKIKETRPAFYRQGIHWSYANCSNVLKNIFEQNIDDFQMDIHIKNANFASGADQDLYLLENIWSLPYSDEYFDVQIKYKDNEKKPKIFILGTSFSDQIVEVLGNRFSNCPMYDELIHYSYLNIGYKISSSGDIVDIPLSINLDETSILSDINNSDIIIIENNATYIPDSYFIVADYLYSNIN